MADMAYIACCPDCKRLVMAIGDTPERKTKTGIEVAKAIKNGYIIERVSVAFVKTEQWGCKCKKGACANEQKAD